MKILVKYKLIIIALIVAIGFLSCKKNPEKLIDLSGLSIVNASPSKENLDVYVDNTKVTAADFTFGTKIDYLTAYSGRRIMTIKQKGTDKTLITEPFILEPQYGYSLFIVDKFPDVKLMLLPDNLTKPPKGKASVRFANLSPDSDPLTLSVDGSPAIITNLSFKNYSDAIFVDYGNNITFQVREHVTAKLAASLPNIKIEEGKIYTIYVSGLKSANDNTKLGVAIYTHK
jgi:hypothetical protein